MDLVQIKNKEGLIMTKKVERCLEKIEEIVKSHKLRWMILRYLSIGLLLSIMVMFILHTFLWTQAWSDYMTQNLAQNPGFLEEFFSLENIQGSLQAISATENAMSTKQYTISQIVLVLVLMPFIIFGMIYISSIISEWDEKFQRFRLERKNRHNR